MGQLKISGKNFKMKIIILISLLGVVCSQDNPPVPVDELDINAYIGLWYNTHVNLFPRITFQNDSYCSTAQYALINETAVTVYNAGRKGSPDGELNDISGIAVTTDEPGELLVYFEGSTDAGDYWVILLGPKAGADNLYQYSVVSDPYRLFLFVLCRDVDDFRANYQAEVLAWLADNGFDTIFTEPREIYHEPDCVYPSSPDYLFK